MTARHIIETLTSPDCVLAVAHGTDKIVLYVLPDAAARRAIESLAAGRSLAELGLPAPTAATNSADEAAAAEAEELASNADYFVELGNAESYREALGRA